MAEQQWFEKLMGGLGEVASEVAGYHVEGFLNSEKENAGLPVAEQQTAAVVDADGGNITANVFAGENVKTYLMIGGAVVLILIIIKGMMK